MLMRKSFFPTTKRHMTREKSKAFREMGRCFEKGIGMEIDEDEVVYCYRTALERKTKIVKIIEKLYCLT